MGLFDWLKKDNKEKKHVFTDDERENSSITRRLNKILSDKVTQLEIQSKIQQIEDIHNAGLGYDDDDDDETSGQDNRMQLLSQVLDMFSTKNNTPNVNQPMPEITNNDKIDLSDGQIDTLIKQNEKYLKKAHLVDDEVLKNLILNRIPLLSEDTLNNVVRKIREKQ